MKITARLPLALALIATLLGTLPVLAQTFSGTNAPGSATNFSLTLTAASTNLSIIVAGNSSAYSHLLLKRGSAPTDLDYDFISAFNGQTTALHLEIPELSAGDYFIRVRTPVGSQIHNFTVVLQTNVSDMRSIGRPVSKPFDSGSLGVISANVRQYFRFEHAGGSPLRVTLEAPNVSPDLYLHRGVVPTESSFLKRSLGLSNDVVGLLDTEALAGSYFVGVFS